MKIKIKQTDLGKKFPLPSYATDGSAGVDLIACIDDQIILHPNQHKLIPTGIMLAIPQGHEAQIRPRSGLALKNKISLVNAPGTIDSDYRGEIGVIAINHSNEDFTITAGMRIAQMVIAPVKQAEFELVDELDETDRGMGGYGSTGTT